MACVVVLFFYSCSNSEFANNIELNKDSAMACNGGNFDEENTYVEEISSGLSDSCSAIENSQISDRQEYIPLNDSDYPYVGLPRIVIETEHFQKIDDCETEVLAKLQIWGDSTPYSEILDITIKGRGNSTWGYPKKPYTIKLAQSKAILGMPKAKKWILLANYRDRTLMRNAVAFELARKTSLIWTPSGRFVEVFLNGKFLGNYFICEKIEANKNRLNLGKNAYLLEFDTYYDGKLKFRTTYNNLPVNIKYPSKYDWASFDFIRNYIDSLEIILSQKDDSLDYLKFIDENSFADYLIVYAMANNGEPSAPKSVFMHKDENGKLTAGPVWDFDYSTFNIHNNGFSNWDSAIFGSLTKKHTFRKVLRDRWRVDKVGFSQIYGFIDSLENYIAESGARNAKLWPIKLNVHAVGDENKSFDEAIKMLKNDIQKRIKELNVLIEKVD